MERVGNTSTCPDCSQFGDHSVQHGQLWSACMIHNPTFFASKLGQATDRRSFRCGQLAPDQLGLLVGALLDFFNVFNPPELEGFTPTELRYACFVSLRRRHGVGVLALSYGFVVVAGQRSTPCWRPSVATGTGSPSRLPRTPSARPSRSSQPTSRLRKCHVLLDLSGLPVHPTWLGVLILARPCSALRC